MFYVVSDEDEACLCVVIHCYSFKLLCFVNVVDCRLDDPVMWGFKGFPTCSADLQRWVLTAEDICFTNMVFSYIFRLGV